MGFTIRQLEIFRAAAEDQNFRETASRLGVSQPCISTHVAALETQVGRPLFERRRGRPVQLTAFGRTFLAQSEPMLDRLSLMRNRSRSDGAALRPVRICSLPHVFDNWLRPSLARYHVQHGTPAIEFIVSDPADDPLAALRAGAADIVVKTSDGVQAGEFAFEKMREVGFGLYGSPAFIDRLDRGEESVPFVLPLAHSSAEQWMLDRLAKRSIGIGSVAARSHYSDVIRDFVYEGMGVSLLFDDEAAAGVAAGTLRKAKTMFPALTRYLVFAASFDHATAEPVVAFLRSVLSIPHRELPSR